jgi:Calcineurin-like phosphoesterase
VAIDLADPPPSRTTRHKSRHVALLSNMPLLGRSTFISRIQQAAAQMPSAKYPRLMAFLEFWRWVLPYLRDCFRVNAPYQSYPSGQTGLFHIALAPGADTLRIAVAADWATGTLEADTVAKNIRACDPLYTLHLGDVYYMGESREVEENCLGESTAEYTGVKWPTGSMGSFALMGNHEMYSGGHAYFKDFLPTLGRLNLQRSVINAQSASYFCLDAGHWLILGLDTGYHSGGIPLLAPIPGVNRVPFLNVDARFDDKMMQWLKAMIHLTSLDRTKRPVLLLSHHQPLSSFEHSFSKPAEQLAQLACLNGQDVVWLYGHEHRLTVYARQTVAKTLSVFPRCIGHGGMPVSVTALKRADSNIDYYDPGHHPTLIYIG